MIIHDCCPFLALITFEDEMFIEIVPPLPPKKRSKFGCSIGAFYRTADNENHSDLLQGWAQGACTTYNTASFSIYLKKKKQKNVAMKLFTVIVWKIIWCLVGRPENAGIKYPFSTEVYIIVLCTNMVEGGCLCQYLYQSSIFLILYIRGH